MMVKADAISFLLAVWANRPLYKSSDKPEDMSDLSCSIRMMSIPIRDRITM
jgi:hypothetical protein